MSQQGHRHGSCPRSSHGRQQMATVSEQEGQKGVLVRRVEPTSPASKVLEKGDVLLSFDGTNIASDGTVPFRSGERISFSYLVSLKFTGDQVNRTLAFVGNAVPMFPFLTALKAVTAPLAHCMSSALCTSGHLMSHMTIHGYCLCAVIKPRKSLSRTSWHRALGMCEHATSQAVSCLTCLTLTDMSTVHCVACIPCHDCHDFLQASGPLELLLSLHRAGFIFEQLTKVRQLLSHLAPANLLAKRLINLVLPSDNTREQELQYGHWQKSALRSCVYHAPFLIVPSCSCAF